MDRSLTTLRLDEFLVALASGEPTPGGGAAAALAGALAAALVAMTCHLTLGRPKFAAVEPDVQRLLQAAEAARSRLQAAIDADAAAFRTVIEATRLPRADAAAAQARTAAIQAALRAAAQPPLAVAQDCAAVLDLGQQAVELVNPSAISDIAVAATLAVAALEGAAENVEVNLALIHDADYVAATRRQLEQMRAGRFEQAEAVRRRAHQRLA